MIEQCLAEARLLRRGPPGPPPRPHLVWYEPTHRWRRRAYVEGRLPQGRAIESLFQDSLADQLVDGVELHARRLQGNDDTTLDDVRHLPTYQDVNAHYALQRYTAMPGYRINRHLREGERLTSSDQSLVDDIMQLMSPLQEAQRLYRGLGTGLSEHWQAGHVMEIDAFMSCSRSAGVATWGFTYPHGAILEIEADPSAYGITLSNQDTFHSEFETLLDLGQVMQIKDRREIVYVNDGHSTRMPLTLIRAVVYSEE